MGILEPVECEVSWCSNLQWRPKVSGRTQHYRACEDHIKEFRDVRLDGLGLMSDFNRWLMEANRSQIGLWPSWV